MGNYCQALKCDTCKYHTEVCDQLRAEEIRTFNLTGAKCITPHLAKDTLCWCCDNLDCPWLLKKKPIKGWTARKHKFPTGGISYHVDECPEFHRGSWKKI